MYGRRNLPQSRFRPLVGTLRLPLESKIKAVALIIAGSGPTDRNGNTKGQQGNNNSLKMLAESLVSQGFASLRYDKRLIGDSLSTTLNEFEIRFEHYISDAEYWLTYLANRFEQPLYVIGHSEGSLIGIVAAKRTPVEGLISIAGAGRPASEILLEQLRRRLPTALMQEAERVISSLDAGDTAEAPQELSAVFRPSIQPYLASWFRYDPAREIRQLNVPVQIIQGATDIQVSVEDAKILHSSALGSRLDLIEIMNHILKPVSGSSWEQASSYSDPSLKLAPELVPVIADFIKNV